MFERNEAAVICIILISDITEKAVCYIHKDQTIDVYFYILKNAKRT